MVLTFFSLLCNMSTFFLVFLYFSSLLLIRVITSVWINQTSANKSILYQAYWTQGTSWDKARCSLSFIEPFLCSVQSAVLSVHLLKQNKRASLPCLQHCMGNNPESFRSGSGWFAQQQTVETELGRHCQSLNSISTGLGLQDSPLSHGLLLQRNKILYAFNFSFSPSSSKMTLMY